MLTGFTPWPEEWADKYRKDGRWKGETFGGMLKERAALYGNETAVTCKDVHWTYKELDERADRLAAGRISSEFKRKTALSFSRRISLSFLK